VLASRWVKFGYHSVDGHLEYKGSRIAIKEEKDLFDRIGLKWVNPEDREL
jgi:DNA polymerase/3'-5' exonuclease PolX